MARLRPKMYSIYINAVSIRNEQIKCTDQVFSYSTASDLRLFTAPVSSVGSPLKDVVSVSPGGGALSPSEVDCGISGLALGSSFIAAGYAVCAGNVP